ncbi:MAG TPA: VOC family protein [Gemmatimonadaceae bacterium]
MGPVWLLLVTVIGAGSQPACVAAASAPALDHAILAVADLDEAARGFSSHGFRLKAGRLHANGLLNRHVKFRDGTSIELMTVRGAARDALAADYSWLVQHAEGGVFVGLAIDDLGVVERAATRSGLRAQQRASGPARFLSFGSSSPAAAVFFMMPGPPVRDADSLVTHTIKVDGLTEALVEGGEALENLLAAMGATQCGSATAPDGRTGRRWTLSRGALVVVRPEHPDARARVLGVVLRSSMPSQRVDTTVFPHPAFWIRARSAAR